MNPSSSNASEITRASNSNLAFALVALPRERRDDMVLFYAFCRVIDDIADEPGPATAERAAQLERWRKALVAPLPGEPPLGEPIRALIAKYQLPREHFLEIISGVEMDLHGTTYETWEDLRLYCHRVASVVGLVSIEIFGYRDPGCRNYAVHLGTALQLTNILRDLGQDYANGGRVYLPAEDLTRFGYAVDDLAAHRRDARFLALMQFEAERALGFYRRARAALPAIDRRSMIAAEIMHAVYGHLLARMQRDGFRVFDRRYRVRNWEKVALIGRALIRARFG